MNKKFVLTMILWCFFTPKLIAAEGLYGVVSLGYADFDSAVEQPKNTGYKLTIGYQVDRQWYAEFGFQQLADQNLLLSVPTSREAAENFAPKLQANALYAALLGKARGQLGELYYRLGVLKTDTRGQTLSAGSVLCEQGTATVFSVDTDDVYTLCDYDEGGVAGVVGLGFDFFLTTRSMLRIEAEHIKGQNDLSINAAYIGLRYNF